MFARCVLVSVPETLWACAVAHRELHASNVSNRSYLYEEHLRGRCVPWCIMEYWHLGDDDDDVDGVSSQRRRG